MPLSKKRMRERKRLDRVSNLNVAGEAALKGAIISIVKPKDEFRWQDQGKQPIPNCPDGRWRA